MDNILDELNEEQIKPVMDTEGQVLVLAGAGSGKTRVLTSRIAYILGQGLARPSQILAITFTNKAAGEMRERINRIVPDSSEMWVSTIHSMCSRILRWFGKSIGVEPNFSIYTETERTNIIKKVIAEKKYGNDSLLKIARSRISDAKSSGLDPDSFYGRYRNEYNISKIVDIYEGYEEHLTQSNALDFDDLLIKTLKLLESDSEARAYLSDKFKYILVDEFQDTNSVQFSIIKLLASSHMNLFAVGDDDQSIYGWRGAEIRNILQFDRDFPEAKVYKLERNYRSSASILDLANVIIKNNKSRRVKELWTDREKEVPPEYYEADEEADEAMFVSRTILREVNKGASYSDFAVLLRMNSLTRAFEQEFAKYSIPYKVFGGYRFFERKEVKDMLAYMRLISNPFDDEAFYRVVNCPKRGIGEKTLSTLETYAADNEISMFYASFKTDEMDMFAKAKEKVTEFAQFIKDMVLFSQTESVDVLVRKIIEVTGIRTSYLDGTEEGDSRAANIDEFVASVDDFSRLNPTATLSDYLNQVTLTTTSDEVESGEFVTIATIHAVKGLEYDQVFICGLEEGVMPISRSDGDVDMEEERRLMYVAVTRAKSKLYLTRSRSRYLYGRREPSAMSEFLEEARPVMGGQIPMISSYFGRDGFSVGRESRGNRSGFSVGGLGNRGGYGYGKGQRRETAREESDYEKFGFVSDGDFYDDADSQTNSRTNAVGSQSKAVGIDFGADVGQKIDNTGKYKVGMRVEHKKFGEGIVIELLKNGNSIKVLFKNGNALELATSIAPLKIISGGD